MNFFRITLVYILFLLTLSSYAQQPLKNGLMQKGWSALVKDNEDLAFGCFWQAYEKAKKENNTADKAASLFYLGICSYGSSIEKGLQYVTQSLNEYKNLEKINPELAKMGRHKCLQLISTIYSRQKKYDDAFRLSNEVAAELKNKNDSSGNLGLAYRSLGTLYEIKKRVDSSEIYYKLAIVLMGSLQLIYHQYKSI